MGYGSSSSIGVTLRNCPHKPDPGAFHPMRSAGETAGTATNTQRIWAKRRVVNPDDKWLERKYRSKNTRTGIAGKRHSSPRVAQLLNRHSWTAASVERQATFCPSFVRGNLAAPASACPALSRERAAQAGPREGIPALYETARASTIAIACADLRGGVPGVQPTGSGLGATSIKHWIAFVLRYGQPGVAGRDPRSRRPFRRFRPELAFRSLLRELRARVLSNSSSLRRSAVTWPLRAWRPAAVEASLGCNFFGLTGVFFVLTVMVDRTPASSAQAAAVRLCRSVR